MHQPNTNTGRDGVKVCYRCKKVKFCGKQRNTAVYLHYPHDSDQVILFLTHHEHNHIDLGRCYFFF